jgi:hypothetical protein
MKILNDLIENSNINSIINSSNFKKTVGGRTVISSTDEVWLDIRNYLLSLDNIGVWYGTAEYVNSFKNSRWYRDTNQYNSRQLVDFELNYSYANNLKAIKEAEIAEIAKKELSAKIKADEEATKTAATTTLSASSSSSSNRANNNPKKRNINNNNDNIKKKSNTRKL